MSKDLVIFNLINDFGMTKTEAARTLEIVQKSLFKAIVQNHRVTLMGFGSFTKKQRSPKMGRNPVTQEPVEIPAKILVKFNPSKVLDDLVNRQQGTRED